MRSNTGYVQDYWIEDDEIPDEQTNVAEVLQIHNRILPRESITDNIDHQNSSRFSENNPFSKISQMTVAEILRNETSGVKRGKGLFSSHTSGLTSINNPTENNQSSFGSKIGKQILNPKYNERAIFNWAKLYTVIMKEYRRHRFNKIAMSRVCEPLSQSSQQVLPYKIQNAHKIQNNQRLKNK